MTSVLKSEARRRRLLARRRLAVLIAMRRTDQAMRQSPRRTG